MAEKILVIGIDGATWDIIDPLLKEGKMPVLQSLIDTGTRATLRSTIPALTPPAWTTSVTGVNPGKHNIYDFFQLDQKTHEKRGLSSRSRKAKPIWKVLEEYGKKSVVINLPMTYPVEQISGAMVTGMMTPGTELPFIYPESLRDAFLLHIPDYEFIIDWKNVYAKDYAAIVQNLNNILEKRLKAGLFLMEEVEWDYFFLVFTEVDRLMHYFWHFYDSTHPLHDKNNPFKDAIPNYFMTLDTSIGKLIEKAPKDIPVVIYSDHGFGPLVKDVYVNNIFEECGWLTKCAQREGSSSREVIKSILQRVGVFTFVRKWYHQLRGYKERRRKVHQVDWLRTKAYFSSLSAQSIHINREGRFSEGIVRSDEVDSLIADISSKLLELRDPDTGERVVTKVHKTQDIFLGPYVENAPDLIIEMKEGYVGQEGFSDTLITTSTQHKVVRTGDHRKDGILILSGDGFAKNAALKPHIIDMAPTILSAFGITPPSSMEGRVLAKAFTKTVPSVEALKKSHPTTKQKLDILIDSIDF